MIPILFPADAVSFNSNGIGRLAECTRCEVTEERNGIYEMELDLPITAKHYPDIVEGMIISATHDDRRDRQPFIIYRRTAPINGMVTFYAHHISYLLTGVILRPYEAETVAEALALMPTYSMNSNPFTFWTDKDTRANFKLQTPTGCRQLLGGMSGSILDVFGGGEYYFDNYTVRLYQKRGRDTDIEIRYGKNLVDLENDFDISGVAGGVVGWWKGGDDETVIHSPIVYADGYGNGSPVKSIDVSSKFEEMPTVQDVTAEVRKYIENNRPYEPNQTIKVDFVQLWQSPEYANVAILQRVFLCDTIKVVYPALGVNVRREVIKVKYDVLLNRYSEMELGTPRTTLIGMTEAAMDEIVESIPIASRIAAAVEHATELITGGLGGHVVMTLNADGEPQEILVMDTDDINTAVNVIRINKNGIGFSTTGYEGPFTNAWTIDGHLVADFIDTGTLNASLITAGTMLADRILGGTFKLGGLNNTNGEMRVYNASGQQIGVWNKDGISLSNGGMLSTTGPAYNNSESTTKIVNGKIQFSNSAAPNDYAEIIADYKGNINQKPGSGGMISVADTYFGHPDNSSRAAYIKNFIEAKGGTYRGTSNALIKESTGNVLVEELTVGTSQNIGTIYCARLKNNDAEIVILPTKFELSATSSTYVAIKGAGLTVNGAGHKSKISNTENYGDRLLFCYEMAAPIYGDIGSGETDDSGVCYVDLDDIFIESIENGIEYNVFLQKEGAGDLWVSEKHKNYFVVEGTKNTKFSWEIKARQKLFKTDRFEIFDQWDGLADMDPAAIENMIMDEAMHYIEEQEVVLYETTK